MKKLLTVFAVTGLLSAGAVRLQAQALIPLSINFKITVQAQDLEDEQVGTSPVFKSTIVKMKVTTKEIIALLGVAYNTTFSNKVSLVVDDDSGDFLLLDGTNVLHNATTDGFLGNFFNTESDDIFSGQANDQTGAANFTDIFTNEIRFRDDPHNNRFSFSGMETWKFSVNTAGKFNDSFTLNGAGTGEVETPPGGGGGTSLIVLSGSVTGKASGFMN